MSKFMYILSYLPKFILATILIIIIIIIFVREIRFNNSKYKFENMISKKLDTKKRLADEDKRRKNANNR